jgi:hypothetical protein
MSILEREILIGIAQWSSHFEKLGYEIPKVRDKWGRFSVPQGEKIIVKVDDLPKNSQIKLTKICDEENCGKHMPNQSYKEILIRRNEDGKDLCNNCRREKRKEVTKYVCKFCGKTRNETEIIKTSRFGKEEFYCKTHYYQMVREGEIKRTYRWKNEIIEHDDYLEIVLYNKDQSVSGTTKISKQHRELVEKYKWHRKVYPNRYSDYVLSTNENNKSIRLHVLIAEVLHGKKPEGMTVDHINRDGLDNRDINLVYKDQTDQNFNQRMHKNNTSGVKGICRQGKYWVAQLRYKHIRLHKIFKEFEDAVAKRKYWEYLIENKQIQLLENEV